MKVLSPITLTDAMLISSDVAEPASGETAWSGATTYALNAEVYLASTHRRYRSLQASNLNKNPLTEPTWWLDIGGTARWAMFDSYVSTATTRTSSLAATIAPGVCDSLFLYGLVGTSATVTMIDGAGGPTVYSKTLNLLVPAVTTWYSYYFDVFRQVPYFVLTDLPPYANGRITLTVTGTGTVQAGMMLACRAYEIGQSQYGVRAGIRDYSRKIIDEATGFVTLEQRKFAKTLQANVRLFSSTFAEVHQLLESLRATPCVWVGDSVGNGAIEPLTVFGFYKDFSLTVDLPSGGVYTLEIEGMV